MGSERGSILQMDYVEEEVILEEMVDLEVKEAGDDEKAFDVEMLEVLSLTADVAGYSFDRQVSSCTLHQYQAISSIKYPVLMSLFDKSTKCFTR